MHSIFVEAYKRLLNGEPVLDLARPIIHEVGSDSHEYQPTWHALGFLHCKVADFEAGQLRLHIWPSGKSHHLEQDLKVHEHLFSVNSCVVRGQLWNVNYDFVAVSTSTEADFQSYSVEYLGDGSRLNPTGRYFKVVRVNEEKVRGGEFYRVKRGVFHETKRDYSEQVVTLVATSEAENRSPFMMGNLQRCASKFRQRVVCEREVWYQEISQVLSYLDE